MAKYTAKVESPKNRMFLTSLCGGLLIGMSVCSSMAFGAAKQYSITGEITGVSPDSVTVKQGVEEFQFNKKDLPSDSAQKMKKGDKVTLFYSMDAKRVTTAQEAGEARPGEVAPGKQHIIQDDRVFQTAGLNSDSSATTPNATLDAHGNSQQSTTSSGNTGR
jgi:hypothetical protein